MKMEDPMKSMREKASKALDKFPTEFLVAASPESKLVPGYSPNKKSDVELSEVMSKLYTRLHGEAGHAVEIKSGSEIETSELRKKSVELLKQKIAEMEEFIKEIE